jgi:hypothetical protein
MENDHAILTICLVAIALSIAVGVRLLGVQIELFTLPVIAVILSTAAVSIGGYWVFAGKTSDQMPGSVLAAGGVIGFAVLAGPLSGCRRPPDDARSE